MKKKWTLVGQISFVGLFTVAGAASAEELRLPIKADSIQVETEGIMGSALQAGFVTDASNGNLTGIICGRPKGSGEVMIMIFGRETKLHMDDQQCIQQLTHALQKIQNEGAQGLSIVSKSAGKIDSIQAY
jgi:hypothetical protein